MVAVVELDVEGSRLVNAWAAGETTYLRMAIVTGLTPALPLALYEEIIGALPALGSILAAGFFSPMTLRSQNIVDIQADPTAPWARVELMYAIDDPSITSNPPNDNGPGVTTGGASVVPFSSNFDPTGSAIETEYHTASGAILKQRHVFEALRPQSTPEHTRREVSSPTQRSKDYVGYLNSDLWNGFAVETVLCTSIQGHRESGATTYVNTYRFEFRETWEQTYIHEDPLFPGFPLPEPLAAHEFVTVKPYPTRAFGPLNIVL